VTITPVQSPLIEAFQKIRMAALLLIIGSLIMGVGAAGSMLSMFTAFGARGFEGVARGIIAGALTATIVALIGAVISLIAIYAYLRPGALELSKADQRYSTASKLINIGYLWGLILIIIGLPLTLIIIGIPIFIIGVILFLIGHIGVILLSFNLNDAEKNVLYLVAGILFIIGLFINILSFIAWILMYVALGESIRRLESQPPTQPPVAMPPSIS